MATRVIHDLAKKLLDPNEREIRRLRRLPRFQPGVSKIFKRPIKFVDAASFASSFRSIFLHRIYEFATDNPCPYIIDGGANIGLATIYWKRLFPGAHILAFEPDPKICQFFIANCDSFGLEGIQLIEKAVWNANGVHQFARDYADSGNLVGDQSSDTIEVQTARLRPFLVEKTIDLLKLDIEGAEVDVLIDCQFSLTRVKRIFVEFHSFCGKAQRLDELLSVLTQAGFRIHIQPDMYSWKPFVNLRESFGMDNRLNIFGLR